MSSPSQPAPNTSDDAKSRYKASLNLPQTTFAMKANLVQNEPASIKRWAKNSVYQRVRGTRQNAPKFVFHDGPPYANGSMHLGHLMNKCLKDFVVRSKGMMGLDVPYIPGWDCHGLPIEHKVMTDLMEGGKVEKLNTLDDWTRRSAIRRECQKHAEKYIKLQSGQLQRFLTLADYEHPYLTMDPKFEAATLEVLATLLERGLVYRALKPVHWSIANETALADAELEYYDREDISVYVDFEAADADAVYDAFGLPPHTADTEEHAEDVSEDLSDAAADDGDSSKLPRPGVRPHQRPCFMIWTTTPWTLPANVGIAINPKFEYVLAYVDGNFSVLAGDALARVTQAGKSEQIVEIARTRGDRLLGLRYIHPFVNVHAGEGVGSTHGVKPGEADSPFAAAFTIVDADYVTLEDGTGLVHTAPGHGVEDYQTGLRVGLPTYSPVLGSGVYDATVPGWLRGQKIWDANPKIVEHLRRSGHLYYDHRFMHSYPHDWRGKTPVIFRCTEQWFVSVSRPVCDSNNKPLFGGLSLRTMGLTSLGAVTHEEVLADFAKADGTLPKAVATLLNDAALAGKSAQDVSSAAASKVAERETNEEQQGCVKFVPSWGRNRLRGMLEARPDWCISRQRSWGLPIPAFELPDGTVFMTAASVRAVASVVKAKGSDSWYSMTAADLLTSYDFLNDTQLSPQVKAALATKPVLKKGSDILDVWFESGSSWNSVMRERGLGYPCDLYLEGSDQHRGWFQLSLLPALGVTGVPPFKTLLTHGFMVDRDGRKLSKSRPDAHRYEVDSVSTEFGMDVMRWWVSSLAYENDVKVDVELFALAGESYRKVRNTLRFMLSNLFDFDASMAVPVAAMSPTSLEAWVIAKFDELSAKVRQAYDNFEFKDVHKDIFDFCNTTLSAEYLVATKDRLYCDAKGSQRRRAAQSALWHVTDGLARLLAPIMPHTADESHRSLWKATDDERCVHTAEFLPASGVVADPQWNSILTLRDQVKTALEQAKTTLGVENPLDASVVVPESVAGKFDPVDLADLFGVSEVTFGSETKVVNVSNRPRCERSWKRDGTVKARSDGGMLSDRDASAVGVT